MKSQIGTMSAQDIRKELPRGSSFLSQVCQFVAVFHSDCLISLLYWASYPRADIEELVKSVGDESEW